MVCYAKFHIPGLSINLIRSIPQLNGPLPFEHLTISFCIFTMATIPTPCNHGAMPRELLDFADIYARENLRAYYCQDCLRKNVQRSTTQLIFNHLCDRLIAGNGTTLDTVHEEPKVAAVDGAASESKDRQDDAQLEPQFAARRLKLPKLNLRKHLRTPAQRKKEQQRIWEQQLVAAIQFSRELRGIQTTEVLLRQGLNIRSISRARSSVATYVRCLSRFCYFD